MCISIVFCIKPKPAVENSDLQTTLREKVFSYGYGCGNGLDSLIAPVASLVGNSFRGYLFFEIHDIQEPHCACDIDQDIRNQAKLGERSSFFNLVNDIQGMEEVLGLSILFADKDSVKGKEVRTESGSFMQFFDRLNHWYTWQSEGYEPTRNSYFIADYSPLIYTLLDRPDN